LTLKNKYKIQKKLKEHKKKLNREAKRNPLKRKSTPPLPSLALLTYY